MNCDSLNFHTENFGDSINNTLYLVERAALQHMCVKMIKLSSHQGSHCRNVTQGLWQYARLKDLTDWLVKKKGVKRAKSKKYVLSAERHFFSLSSLTKVISITQYLWLQSSLVQVCQSFILTCSKGRRKQLIGHKREEAFSIKLKLSLHMQFYVLMLTNGRWHKMCQTVQKSADNKLMLTIINGTMCLSTFRAQHFLQFGNFSVICYVRALEYKNVTW